MGVRTPLPGHPRAFGPKAEREASGAFPKGKGGSNGVGSSDSVEMATGEHERQGQVRGGGTKRAAPPSPGKQRVRPK